MLLRGLRPFECKYWSRSILLAVFLLPVLTHFSACGQEVSTAERSKEAEPATGRSEQQADDQVTDIKDKAEAAGEDVEIEKQGSEVKVTKGSGEQIYIGFDKGDKDRSKPGRMISDDPSRYPDRTSTTGGWSGGEQGLAAFIEVCPNTSTRLCPVHCILVLQWTLQIRPSPVHASANSKDMPFKLDSACTKQHCWYARLCAELGCCCRKSKRRCQLTRLSFLRTRKKHRRLATSQR